MNFKYVAVLVLVIAVLAGGAYYSLEPLQDAITLGLDISGGITVLLEAVPTEDVPVINDDAMSRAVAIITQRVNGLGVAEAEVVREGSRRIRVSLPGFENQEDAMSILMASSWFSKPGGRHEYTRPNRHIRVSGHLRRSISVGRESP